MTISRTLYLLSRTARDVEVLSGRNGSSRLVKRVVRRAVRRRTGRLSDVIWRKF